jgi:hypothetical protein
MASTGLLIAEVSCNLVTNDPSNKDAGILALTKNVIKSKEATTISGNANLVNPLTLSPNP